MDILVHCDGLPGGLVLVCVDVSQVGSVVSLGGVICVADLTLAVEAPGLETELGLLIDSTGHILRSHSHRGVTDYILEGRHASQGLVEVVCSIAKLFIARTSFIEGFLKRKTLPTNQDEEQED